MSGRTESVLMGFVAFAGLAVAYLAPGWWKLTSLIPLGASAIWLHLRGSLPTKVTEEQ